MIDPSAEQLAALAGSSHEGPIAMVNLLAFRVPDGADSYRRYAEAVQPHLDRVGARAIYLGGQRQMVIGEGERPWWDAILLVEYPAVSAFLEMVSDPGYQEIHIHRAEALERAELIMTQPGTFGTE